MEFDLDPYGEVVNGAKTYQSIRNGLATRIPVMIGWTDQEGTHLDILFTPGAYVHGGTMRGGIRPREDAFVSIMRFGAFGFQHGSQYPELSAMYVSEKLGFRGSRNPTVSELTDLLNAVIRN